MEILSQYDRFVRLNLSQFELALKLELIHDFPSRVGDVVNHSTLVAHPELLTSQRPYRPEWELELFDLQRVDAYLADFTWTRTCTSVGQLRMRKVRYSLGYAWAHQDVSATFDPEHHQFVFTQIRSETRKGKRQPKLDPVRRDAKNLSVEDITGLADALNDLPTQQLMLPLFICYPQPDVVTQGHDFLKRSKRYEIMKVNRT